MVSSSDSSFASAPVTRLLILATLSLILTNSAVAGVRLGIRIGGELAESPYAAFFVASRRASAAHSSSIRC